MERRAFLGTVAGGLVAAPFAAEAQRVARVPHIGAMEDTPTRPHREMVIR